MQQYKIVDLAPGVLEGVDVQMPGAGEPYRENWFEWTATSLRARLQTTELAGGVLKTWKHTPVFSELEFHKDCEMFYFVRGTAIMPFADIKDGRVDPESIRMVRIQAGSQIVIHPGKAHFVGVAQGDEPVEIIVTSPAMDAPRIRLDEPVEGIF